jgi:hypothetical protein
MEYQESVMVIKKITVFYQNFVVTEEKIQDWSGVLQEYDLYSVMERLNDHVRANKFPPTLSDLLPNEKAGLTNVGAYIRIEGNTLEKQAEEARLMLERLEGDRFKGKPLELPSFMKKGKK